MASEFIPLESYYLYQSSTISNETSLKTPNNSSGSWSKPPRPSLSHSKHQSKSYRETDRSVSQKRRFHSIGSSRSQQSKKKLIVKQQPAGWYQVSSITRNLSLAPRTPSREAVATDGVAGDQPPRGKRRNRRRQRATNKWFGQSRFPSPTLLNSTLGLLRELPCARMHYDSFKRIFQTMPTRTMRDRKFRLEAAQELPFAKYPDDQMKSMLDDSWRTIDTMGHVQHVEPWNNGMEELIERIPGCGSLRLREGDIKTMNDTSELSTDTKNEASNDHSGDNEGQCPDSLEETDEDLLEDAPVKTVTIGAPEILKLDSRITEEQRRLSTTAIETRPSTTVSDDFVSLSESEGKREAQSQVVETESVAEDESSPGADAYIENNATMHIPVGGGMQISVVREDELECPGEGQSRLNMVGRKSNSDEGKQCVPRSPSSIIQTQSCEYSRSNTKKESTEPDDLIPTPQAAVSLFESACVGHTMGAILCGACGQPAYPAERCEADGQVFHWACFRCHQCGTMLQRGAWNQRETLYYCNPCHRRIALQTLRH